MDEVVLALLFLNLHDGCRAWKGLDWAVMERLHAKSMIGDPIGRAKSVVLTEQGRTHCEDFFRKHFGRQNSPSTL